MRDCETQHKSGNGRIDSIDIAKGIGIGVVYLVHVSPVDCFSSRVMSTWFMPIFFVISGLCFNEAKYCCRMNSGFISSRIRTLLFPLLVFTLIFAGIEVMTGYDYFSFHKLASGSLPFATWFLVCLFLTELIYWLCCLVSTNRLWLASVVFLTFAAGILLQGSVSSSPWCLNSPLLALPFYGCGHLLRTKWKEMELGYRRISLKIRIAFITGLCAFAISATTMIDGSFSIPELHIPNPWAMCYAISIAMLSAMLMLSMVIDERKPGIVSRLHPILMFGGKNSLAIMIFHMWWIKFMKDFVRPLIGIGLEPLLAIPMIYLTIIVINRYAPWMLGKKIKKEN